MATDPTVSVKLYSWSSEEFGAEHALVYTSRSYHTLCISHWRVNQDKVLFTLQDGLCVGNPVRIDMEIKAERDHRGLYVIRKFKVRSPSGKFMRRTDEPGLCVRQYRDKFHQRQGKLQYCSSQTDEAEIDFTTGLTTGRSGLTYSITVRCDPFKGIGVDLCGPELCCFRDPLSEKTIIGLCSNIEYVRGKPPHHVLERIMSESKEEKKGNDSDATSSRAPSSTQRSDILNSGSTIRGAFNGAIFNDCQLIGFGRGLSI